MKLEEKALLVKLTIGVWEGKKKDREVELGIDEKYHSKNAGSFRKALFDSPELKAIESAAAKARDLHKTMTMPWGEDSTGILASELYPDYVRKLGKSKDDFEESFVAFKDIYDAQIEKEKIRLNSLFNLEDYPSKRDLRKKFHFETSFLPIPTSGDFRVNMQADEVEKIKATFEEDKKRELAEAGRKLYQRLYSVIQKMYERLQDPKAKFHDTLVSNIAEQVAILPILNSLVGDEKLAELTKLAEEELASLDPQDLRDSKELRKVTAEIAGEIIKEIEEIL